MAGALVGMLALRQRGGLQRVVSAALLASYLLVLAMAASPSLHEWLHGDADEPGHQCAAVTAIHAQVDRPPPTVEHATLAPAASWIEVRRVCHIIRRAPLFLVIGVMEHAPPTFD